MNPFHVALLNSMIPKFEEGTPALSPSDTSLDSIFWAQPYKSSLYPQVTTTKNYFVIYSTDHDTDTSSSGGKIAWGEFDSFDGDVLSGFVERGVIRTGYQNESPFAITIPTAVSGLASDDFFLYYHTMYTDPRNVSGVQETHLMTCSGGELHNAAWTERGKVLGLETGEDHTGYAKIWKRDDGVYVAHHHYDEDELIGGAWSTSTDGINWTRQGTITGYENMPDGGTFYRQSIFPIKRNGKWYGLFRFNTAGDHTTGGYLALAELDPSNFMPQTFIKKVVEYNIKDLTVYYEGDEGKIMMKADPGNPNYNPYYIYNYDLTELDSL